MPGVTAIKVGYARCSIKGLQAARQILLGLGVSAEQIYLDRACSGLNRARPGLDQALAAVAPATPWSSRNSTGSPGRCPTPGVSATPLPVARFGCSWAR
jgi:hypothetical protein